MVDVEKVRALITAAAAAVSSARRNGLAPGIVLAAAVLAASLLGARAQAQTVAFDASSYTATEYAPMQPATGAAVTVTLTPAPTAQVTIPLTTTNADGTVNADYSGVPSSVRFLATETESTFTVTAANDSKDEPDKSFTLGFGGLPAGVTAGTPATATVTLVDEDGPPELSFDPTSASATEGNAITFTVKLSAASEKTVTVRVDTFGDTTETEDFTAVSTTLTFEPGDTSKTVTVSTANDMVDEDYETFTVTLSDASNAEIDASAGTATGTINDNDARPALTVTADPTQLVEGIHKVNEGETARWTATLAAASERTLTFDADILRANNTTASSSDYTLPDSTLVFSPGETSKTHTVNAVDDAVDEVEELFASELAAGSFTASNIFHIIDNDDPPTVSVADARADEGDGVEFTATLSGPSEILIWVDYTASIETGDTAQSGDLTGTLSGRLVFVRGETSKTFTIRTREDSTDEDNETFTVTLSNPSAVTLGTSTARGTIEDDDSATLSINDRSAAEGSPMVFTVTLSTASTKTVTVNYATSIASGDTAETGDFTSASGTLTFTAGDTSEMLTVSIPSDRADEDDETFTVTLSSPSNATISDGTGRGTIQDRSDPPEVRVGAAEADEGSGAAFTVALSPPSEKRVTVSYATSRASGDTAEVGDFTAVTSTTLTFEPGDTEKTVTVDTTHDTTDEENETFTLTLSSPSNATLSSTMRAAKGTIRDNDDPPVLSISDAEAVEGQPVIFTVKLSAVSEKRVTVGAFLEFVGGTAKRTDLGSTALGRLTFSPGETLSTITIGTMQDNIHERDETFLVVLTAASNADIDGDGIFATGTILNDDDPPTVALSLSRTSVAENSGTAVVVTARLVGRSAEPTTVTVSATPMSPATSSDFTVSTNKTLSIAAEETASTGEVTVTPVDNETNAPDKQVTVSATAANDLAPDDTLTAPSDLTLTITEDDPEPVVTLNLGPSSICEVSGNNCESGNEVNASTVTATLDRPSSEDTTVEVTAAAVGAAVPADFTLARSTLTIAAGDTDSAESAASVTITAVDNNVDAPDKQVRVSGDAENTQGIRGDPADKTLTIEDDEPAPKVTLVVAHGSIRESDDPATIDVDDHVTTIRATLQHPSSQPTTVTVTASSTDFTLSSSGRLTIPAGATESSASVTLTAVDDDTDAPDKELTLSATGVNTQGLEQPDNVDLTIEDDEPAPVPALVLSPVSMAIGEKGGRATVRAELSHPSSEDTAVTVSATPEGAAEEADFELAGSVLSIPAGRTVSTGSATLTAVDNNVDAPDKEVTVSATATNTQGISGPPESLTLTIEDDEPAPTVTLTLSLGTIPEAAGETVVTAQLSHPSSQRTALTVMAEAVSPTLAADFTQRGIGLNIPAGLTDSVGTVSLAAVDNDVDAADKRVRVTAAAANTQGLAGDPSDLTLTIEDDDTRGIAWVPERLTVRHISFDNTFTVALTSEPTADVTVTLRSPIAGPGQLALDGFDFEAEVTLTFTAANWSVPREVTYSAAASGDRTIRHSAAGGDYAGLARNYPVTTFSITSPATEVALTVDRTSIDESAGLKTLNVTAFLKGQPRNVATEVTVTVGPGTTTAGDFDATPPTFDITIPPGDGRRSTSFALAPVDDGLDEDSETVLLSGATDGLTVTGAEVTILDDDTRGVTVSRTRLPVDEDGSRAYTVVLDSEPSAAVTVTATVSGSPDVTASPEALTFTADDWETPQPVTVSAAADDDPADEQATVRHAVSGGDYGANNVRAAAVLVTVDDDDGRGVTVSARDVTVAEGESETYTVVLNTQPTGNVSVTPRVAGDADVTVKPPRLTFTTLNWETVQTVTVTAADDADPTDDRASVSHAVSGADYGSNRVSAPEVFVTVRDAGQTLGMATITVQDAFGNIETREVREGGPSGSETVVVTLDGPTRPTPTRVTVLVRGDTASASDFRATPGAFVVTIPANRPSGQATFTLSVVDDRIDEEDETLTLTGHAQGLEMAPYAITIRDNDERGVRVSPSSLTVDEDRSAPYRVALTSEPTGAVTVTPLVSGAQEVTVRPETLTFTAADWSRQQTVTVLAARDPDGEDDDEAEVTHTANGGDYVEVTGGAVAVRVRDDGIEFEGVRLEVDVREVAEGGTAQTVTVTAFLDILPLAAETAVTVQVRSDTATEGTDFTDVPDFVITIPAEGTEAEGSFTLTPVDDVVDEGEGERLIVGGTAPDLLVRQTDVTITDDDAASTEVTLTVDPETLAEDAAGAARVVTVSAALDAGARVEDTEVRLTVSGGTATQGTDFEAVSAFTLTIAAEMTSGEQSFTLAPVDDRVHEPAETVLVRGRASGLRVEPAGGAEVTIADNEATPAAVLELSPASVREDGGVSRVTATLDPASSRPTRLTVASEPGNNAAGADFRQSGTTLTIPAGATRSSGSVTVRAVDNDVLESEKEVTISAAATNDLEVTAPGNVTLTITDDESPSTAVVLAASPAVAGEGRTTRVTVTAMLDGAPRTEATEVTVTVTGDTATEGEDFAAVAEFVLTIPAERTSGRGTFNLAPVDDDVDEPDETVRVSGSTPGLTVTAAAVTIADQAPAPPRPPQPPQPPTTPQPPPPPVQPVTLALMPERVSEGATGAARTVRVTATLDGGALSTPTEVTVTVTGGTAAEGADFAAVADFVLTIPAGAASGTGSFTLSPVDDAVDEGDETVVVTGAGTGVLVAPAAGLVVTIADDDERGVTVQPAALTLVTGGSGTYELVLNSRPTAAVTIAVAANNPGVTAEPAAVTFEPEQWNTAREVTVTVAGDGSVSAGAAVGITHAVTGGDYGENGTTAAPVTVGVTASTVTLSLSREEVAEGAAGDARTVTVTATLTSGTRSTGTEVTVTVSGGTATEGDDYAAVADFVLTIPAGETSGTGSFTLSPVDDAVDEAGETVVVSGAGAGVMVAPAAGVVVTIVDDDERGVTVKPAALTVVVGDSGAYELALGSRPTAAVTIAVSADNPGVRAEPAAVTFEPERWNTAREVTVTVAGDGSVSAGATVELTHTVTGGDYGANGATADPVTVAVTAPAVTLLLSPEEVAEGATGDARTVTVTATLRDEPQGTHTEVTVTVSGGTATEGADFAAVSDFVLTILAGETSGAGSFTLSPVDDAVDEVDETVVVTGTVTGGGSSAAAATIADDDERGVTATPRSLAVLKGGSGSYHIALSSRPTAAVTIAVSSDNPGVRAEPAAVTFEPGEWEESRMVTVRAADDDALAGAAVELSHAVSGGDYGDNGVTLGPVTVTVTQFSAAVTVSPEQVAEGATGASRTVEVTVTLEGAARAEATAVTVTVSGGTAAEGEDFAAVADFVLTIPAGEASGTGSFTLAPVDDAVDEPGETVVVTAAAPGLATAAAAVTITDNDERGVTVMPTALTVREGGSDAYEVVLASQPTANVTVTVSSDDPDVTADPPSLTFTASSWSRAQTVTVSVRDDDRVEEETTARLVHAVSGGGYGSVAADSVAVTVPGHEVDGMAVRVQVPATGEVAVPDGGPVPDGTRVTVPAALAGETLVLRAAADSAALADPPRGYNAGDAVVDIELGGGMTLGPGQTATVCLPVGEGGSGRVYRYDESAEPPEWVQLPEPVGGSPSGLACGVTDRFSLFAVGSAPHEAVAAGWLGRFGRLAAQHVTDALQERLSRARTAGLTGSLAGQGLAAAEGRGPGSRPGAGNGLKALEGWGPGSRPGAGSGLKALERRGPGSWPGAGSELKALQRRVEAGSVWAEEEHGMERRSLTVRELVRGTRFSLTGAAGSGGSVGLWGQGALSRFTGREGEATVEGDVTTATLGADWASEGLGLTAGLAVSHSRGEGTWQRDGGEAEEVESSLTGVYPYLGYEVTERVSVWGVVGHGRGELSLPDGSGKLRTDIDMTMTAAGARSDLVRAGSGGGPDLAFKVDGLYLRMGADAARGLETVEADVSRLRLGLEGSWAMKAGDGPTLTPSLEVGVRQDWGEVETGTGVEVGGGLAYSDPQRGVSAGVKARGLVAHKAEEFEDWGLSGSLALDLDPSSERGFSFSLRQSLGAASSDGVDALFRRDSLAELTGDGEAGGERRLEAETAYGFEILGGRFTGTPYLKYGLSRTGRDYTLGWRLAPLPSPALDLEFRVGATRRESAGGGEPEHGVALEAKLRW